MSFLCPTCASKTLPNPFSSEEDERSFPAEWEAHHTPQQMRDALSKTIATIITLQHSVLGPQAAEPNDLNVAVTDGVSLVASRFRNHPSEQPPSLYYSTAAGVTLNRQFPDHPDGAKGPYGSGKGKSANGKEAARGAQGHNPHAKRHAKEHGTHLIVASEPTTYKDDEWTLIEKNRCLVVGSAGLVGIEEVGYPGGH